MHCCQCYLRNKARGEAKCYITYVVSGPSAECFISHIARGEAML